MMFYSNKLNVHSQFESRNVLFQLSFSGCLFRVAEAPVAGRGQSLSQLGLLKQNTHIVMIVQIMSHLQYIYIFWDILLTHLTKGGKELQDKTQSKVKQTQKARNCNCDFIFVFTLCNRCFCNTSISLWQ